MSGSVGASLLKGNGELELSLGSSCLVAVGQTSKKSSFKPINQEPEENCGRVVETLSNCTTQENTTQNFPSCGWKGIDVAISQILRHSGSSNGDTAEEVRNNKGSGKPWSSQYKGVVAQPNGRWGAQIYEKHKRVWLGTFNTEEDAAQSYDTAALKFRGLKAITNFVPTGDTHKEGIFLGLHSKAEIVDMLRTHTYHEELHHSCKMNAPESNGSSNSEDNKMGDANSVAGEKAVYQREHLFEKALTPSDVGKLNRLVIPKHHAHRCLPLEATSRGKGVILNFEDATGKTWRFRYSYWNSSQSYVLTKGWSRYSKGNRLQSGDIVTFERRTGSSRQLYISFRSNWLLSVVTPLIRF